MQLRAASRNSALYNYRNVHAQAKQKSNRARCLPKTPPAGLEPAIFGLEVRRLVH